VAPRAIRWRGGAGTSAAEPAIRLGEVGGRARGPVARWGGEVGGGARDGGVPRAAEPTVKMELRGAWHGGERAGQLAGQSSPAYARCRHGRWSGGVRVESENGDAREREGGRASSSRVVGTGVDKIGYDTWGPLRCKV
jgi:hypothetical protein